VIVGHVMGIPVEESVLALAPAGAAMVTTVWIAGRTSLRRLRRRLGHRSAVERMRTQNLTNLPVTTSDGRLTGLLTRRDAESSHRLLKRPLTATEERPPACRT
jgi:CBS domain